MSKLEKEFQFYKDNKAEFVEKYEGRHIVIKGHELLGVYDGLMEAINQTRKDHELGSFMVHKVQAGDETVYLTASRIAI